MAAGVPEAEKGCRRSQLGKLRREGTHRTGGEKGAVNTDSRCERRLAGAGGDAPAESDSPHSRNLPACVQG